MSMCGCEFRASPCVFGGGGGGGERLRSSI